MLIVWSSSVFFYKSGTSMSTLPPGGSVYMVLLLSVQFSEKWIHIDLCYKGTWTNNHLTPSQCQTHSEFNGH